MKIAPTLQWHIQDPFASDALAFAKDVPQMVRELRALLAVARQVQKQAREGNNWPKVLRALSRLDRLGGRKGKR